MSPETTRAAPRREAGLTLIEVMVAATLGLLVAIALYDLFESSNRSYLRESGLANAQNNGRVALDLFAADVRTSGYNPIGYPFYAVPWGDATRVRLLADLDGDAAVGLAGETGENLSYIFEGPSANGLFTFSRGVDLNGDWDFDDGGELLNQVIGQVVPIDFDLDGEIDPFLDYDIAPPTTSIAYDITLQETSLVRITFGVRSDSFDTLAQRFPTIKFRSDVAVRNR